MVQSTTGAKAPARKPAAPAQEQGGGAEQIYRQLVSSWNLKDCNRVRSLAGELEKIHYDTQNALNMSNAYQLRSRCQVNQADAERDRTNASRLLLQMEDNATLQQRANRKAGKAAEAVEKKK
jgi:hypothetical protein